MWWRVVAPAAGVMAASLAWGALWPRSRWFGPVRWQGEVEGEPRRIGLLFECPGNGDCAIEVLRGLDRADAPAAFAVDLSAAVETPELLRRMHGAGHLLVNAGPVFAPANLFAGYPAWRRMIDQTEDAIHDVIGRRPLLFAPPHAIKSPVMLREAAWGGHGLVVRARGQHLQLPRSWDTARLRRAPAAGIVALRADQPRTIEQLPSLLDAWRGRGRWITRLDVLLNVPPYRRGVEPTL